MHGKLSLFLYRSSGKITGLHYLVFSKGKKKGGRLQILQIPIHRKQFEEKSVVVCLSGTFPWKREKHKNLAERTSRKGMRGGCYFWSALLLLFILWKGVIGRFVISFEKNSERLMLPDFWRWKNESCVMFVHIDYGGRFVWHCCRAHHFTSLEVWLNGWAKMRGTFPRKYIIFFWGKMETLSDVYFNINFSKYRSFLRWYSFLFNNPSMNLLRNRFYYLQFISRILIKKR